MMGLQATATKRKYEIDDGDIQDDCTPAKASRWAITSIKHKSDQIPSAEDSIAKLEAVASVPATPWGAEPIVDSISRLQAVAVPDTWGSDSSRTALATTLLNTDDLEDEDFEDDFDEEESIIPSFSPIRYPCLPTTRSYVPPVYHKPSYYSEPYPQQNCSRTPSHQYTRPSLYGWNNNGYYIPESVVSSQQTIRCAENGKSYLELGCGSYSSFDLKHFKRCCDGRTNWCSNKQCYRDRRLKIRNLSMFKLSRFRQVSEQSLYRSVLICNTLKCIDREMEMEMKESTKLADFHANQYSNVRLQQNNNNNNNNNNGTHTELSRSPSNQYSSSDSSNNSTYSPSSYSNTSNSTNKIATSSIIAFNECIPPYDHHPLKDSQSGRATPFPINPPPDTDSGYGDDDCTRPINWGSVLSLSSQLDPLNNNDLFAPPTPITISSNFTSTPVTNNASSPATNSTSLLSTTTSNPSTNWEYNLLDMDLGLGPELTELLPSWKLTPLSADDILKSVPPPTVLESNKSLFESEMDTLTHIMVGS